MHSAETGGRFYHRRHLHSNTKHKYKYKYKYRNNTDVNADTNTDAQRGDREKVALPQETSSLKYKIQNKKANTKYIIECQCQETF